jgi:hypothetical protein
MENGHFDTIVRSLTTATGRRSVVKALAATLGVTMLGVGAMEVDARRGKKRHKKHHGGGTVPPPPPASPSVQFLQPCSPGDVCVPPGDGITTTVTCGLKTTDHTCSGSFPGVTTYCCVPQGAPCFNNSCQCCGSTNPNIETYCGNPDPVTGGTCTTR